MARRWAPNDGGDSDDSGEPRPSAGRQTPAPHSVGFDDSWKDGNRNTTGSGFGPGEFGAIPQFQLSRDRIPMPDTEPPRRSRFIAAFLRLAPVALVSATAALSAVWIYSENRGSERSQVADSRASAVPTVNSTDQGASAASPLAAVAPSAPLLAARANAGGTVRGITDREIRFGMAAPFSGSAKELGHEMKIGIEAASRRTASTGGNSPSWRRTMATNLPGPQTPCGNCATRTMFSA